MSKTEWLFKREKMNKTVPTEWRAVNIFTELSGSLYTAISLNIYLFPFLHKELSKIPTDIHDVELKSVSYR